MPKKPAEEKRITQEERDLALDKSYSWHREYDGQTMSAYVSANRDDLAEEFQLWRPKATLGNLGDMVQEWEQQRFGRALEPGAHGVLMHAVRRTSVGGPKFEDKHWDSNSQRDDVEWAVKRHLDEIGKNKPVDLHEIAKLAGLQVPDDEKPLAKAMPTVKPQPKPESAWAAAFAAAQERGMSPRDAKAHADREVAEPTPDNEPRLPYKDPPEGAPAWAAPPEPAPEVGPFEADDSDVDWLED